LILETTFVFQIRIKKKYSLLGKKDEFERRKYGAEKNVKSLNGSRGVQSGGANGVTAPVCPNSEVT